MTFYTFLIAHYRDGKNVLVKKVEEARFPKCRFSQNADWHGLMAEYFQERGIEKAEFEDCWADYMKLEKGRKYYTNEGWFKNFLDSCCEIDSGAEQKSGELYTAYRTYCRKNGDFAKSTTEFYAALNLCGFIRKKNRNGRFVHGLKLISSDLKGAELCERNLSNTSW